MTLDLHSDRAYAAELQEVRNRILLMAGHVESMIARSVRALGERDPALARETIAIDAEVNLAECDVDDMCLALLARWHPGAADLRFVTLALKMVTDLERIGDLAVNICERAIDLSQIQRLRSYENIYRLADLVQPMVHDAIDAFVDGCIDGAEAVIARDDAVDALYDRVFGEILAEMHDDPASIQRGVHVQSVAKWLERMADHATNIAEQVIFMVQGEDVRHRGRLSRRGHRR